MLARLLIRPFGSIWKLKSRCQSSRGKISRRILITLYELYQYENSSSIAYNSSFENEPCFPHGMKSIFISGGSKIGKNCVIFQQVTIGSITLPDANSLGAPSIGDNCFIGAGATIIGNVTIGNNVRIGANTVVYKDVSNNSIVVSAEQKNILKKESLDNKFYSYRGRWQFYQDGRFHDVEEDSTLARLNEMN